VIAPKHVSKLTAKDGERLDAVAARPTGKRGIVAARDEQIASLRNEVSNLQKALARSQIANAEVRRLGTLVHERDEAIIALRSEVAKLREASGRSSPTDDQAPSLASSTLMTQQDSWGGNAQMHEELKALEQAHATLRAQHDETLRAVSSAQEESQASLLAAAAAQDYSRAKQQANNILQHEHDIVIAKLESINLALTRERRRWRHRLAAIRACSEETRAAGKSLADVPLVEGGVKEPPFVRRPTDSGAEESAPSKLCATRIQRLWRGRRTREDLAMCQSILSAEGRPPSSAAQQLVSQRQSQQQCTQSSSSADTTALQDELQRVHKELKKAMQEESRRRAEVTEVKRVHEDELSKLHARIALMERAAERTMPHKGTEVGQGEVDQHVQQATEQLVVAFEREKAEMTAGFERAMRERDAILETKIKEHAEFAKGVRRVVDEELDIQERRMKHEMALAVKAAQREAAQ
jgi:hypothetical protein